MAEDRIYIEEVLATGSASAYGKLIEMYQGSVFSLCYNIVHNREEAEEIAQDVFLKCYRSLAQLRDPSKFRNWLMSIAYSKAIDKVRLKKVINVDLEKAEADLPAEQVTPLTETGQKDRSTLLNEAIQKLNPEEAAVITLFYLEEQSVRETAEITGIGVSNVKVRLFRARESLRRILEKDLKKEIKDLLE